MEAKLEALGAIHPIDCLDLDQGDLASLGMRKLERKRWEAALEEIQSLQTCLPTASPVNHLFAGATDGRETLAAGKDCSRPTPLGTKETNFGHRPTEPLRTGERGVGQQMEDTHFIQASKDVKDVKVSYENTLLPCIILSPGILIVYRWGTHLMPVLVNPSRTGAWSEGQRKL